MAATPQSEVRNGIQVEHPRYPLPPKIGMSIAPLLLAIGARRTIRRMLRQGWDFDLIDAHYFYPDGVAAALLAGWLKKPFVVTARGTDLNVLPDYYVPRRWIQWAESRAAATILVSHKLSEKLAALGGNRLRMQVLRNGVDLELFRPMDRADCRRQLGLGEGRWLLSVGNLVSLKGHDISISALRELPEDVGLAIVGHGAERQRLESLAARLGLSDRVRLIGALPQSDLPVWYNAADALVLCSSREGMPNVLLESLSCGTPVVSTAVGGVPEIIESPVAGRLLRDRSVAALAAAVLDLLSSDIQRDQVREYASQFDWSATTRGQLELFRDVLDLS